MVDCACATYTHIPRMSSFTQNAIETGNLQYFQNIKDDKSIKEIASRKTEPGLFSRPLTFFELALARKQWQLCKFFTTSELWRPYVVKQFFNENILNKDLFLKYYKLALENKDETLDLEIIFTQGAATKNKKKFLHKLALLAHEKKNEFYQGQIEKLMKQYNSVREEKVSNELVILSLFAEEKLNSIVIDYLNPTEPPRYQPGKFNIF